MRRFALLLALGLAGLPAPAGAETAGEPDLRPVATRAVDGFVRPGYERLADAAKGHAAGWVEVCVAPDRAGVGRLAVSFRRLADAWARIEFVRYGPVVEDFRAERINFWPDKRNATTRGLAELTAAGAAEPTVASVRAASAAVQGLPALERLLFDPGAAERLASTSSEGARACAAGRAIAAGLALTTAEVAAGWGPLADATTADPAAARETAARLTTDLLAGFQTLIDGKLLPALGKTAETARPEALEGRRAGRVRASFAEPLAGQEALATLLAGSGPQSASLTAALATVRSVADGLPDDFADSLAQPKRRSKAILLLDALRAAQDVALSDLPVLVGVTVGFNSRDGD